MIFILADDLGWSDTTLYGTTKLYETPNLERLAARGMTFTRAYSSSPLCSPTRASILTGLSPARHGITAPNCHSPNEILQAVAVERAPANSCSTMPVSVTRLKTEYYTLPELLKDNGYATGHFGKWHLGPEPYSPLQHGFDVDVPHHAGPGPAGSYVAPWKFKGFDHDPDIPDEHIEDRMAKEASAFIEQHRSRPFFLNYWMFSVHAPFDAKKKLIDKYRGKVSDDESQRSPTYAAMIESMDDAVGSLLDTLDRLEIADSTIIIFASDNGGNMYDLVDGGTATSNTPLRGGKATMYEGGVRGPAVVVYPKLVEAGSRSEEIIQSVDYYPTVIELLGLSPATGQQFDGTSIAAALGGKSLDRKAIFTYFPHAPNVPDWLPPSISVHSGDWKLIRIFHGEREGAHRYKLFNLSNDLGELQDVAESYPDLVKQLDQRIEEHLIETGAVRPLRNPAFDRQAYDIQQEGKVSPAGRASSRQKPAKALSKQPISSWTPAGTCTLSLESEKLIVQSSGNDPHLTHRLSKPAAASKFLLRFTMSSNSNGPVQVFWLEEDHRQFQATRSQSIAFVHDGQSRESTIEFVAQSPLVAIRIDPSQERGTMEISRIELIKNVGDLVYRFPSQTTTSTQRNEPAQASEKSGTQINHSISQTPALAIDAKNLRPNIIVVYTDDHGYADLGCQGIVNDIKTPHIDSLAANGVRFTNGYCTAPQCVPSRGGLLTGQYQTKWGLESNEQFNDAPTLRKLDLVETIPERLKQVGYATGMAGKWHLGPGRADAIARHGFDKVFHKHSNAAGHWNMSIDGNDVPPQDQQGDVYHIDMISQFACSFIERFQDQPFFFYLACRAPHVPLDAPQNYLNRFPGEMPERRRQALAMISAVDDGVGKIVASLRKLNLEERTLLFVISDNGAPLKIDKPDTPGGGPGWDGSLNEPLNVEKGMLTEGGIRVPFVAQWKGVLPAGMIYSHPVITLDVGATACAMAGLPNDPLLDGVNLIPYLSGKNSKAPHGELYWRWLAQSAVRKGKWKYIRSNDREFLFNLEADEYERHNLVAEFPDVASSLQDDLKVWAATQSPPGIGAVKSEAMSRQADLYYDWYMDGKRAKVVPERKRISEK